MSRAQPNRRNRFPHFQPPLTPCNVFVQRCPVPREEASPRILIMRAGAFGDILMGTPLLAALRAAYPKAHLTWIVEHKEVEAIDTNPFIDECLIWDSSYWKNMLRRLLYPLWLLRALQMRSILHRKQYDIFISFQPEEWPLLLRGAGAPTTIGVFDTFRQFNSENKTSRYAKFYSKPFSHPNLPEHRTDQYLLPLRALGLPEAVDKRMNMGFTAADAEAVETFLSGQGLAAGTLFVVLAPMTTWPSRCWPGERFAELGDALTLQAGCRIVLIGSGRKTEQEAVMTIASQMKTPPIIAAGVLSFRQMAALIAHSAALVSGDTGPMHVAAAVGTPFVALFGPTPAAGRAPLAGSGITMQRTVPCGPCDQKFCPNPPESHLLCLRLISVDEAADAVMKLLQPVRANVDFVP